MNPEFFTMDSTRAEEVSKNHNSAIIADVHNYEEIIYSNDDWIPLGPLNDIAGDNKVIIAIDALFERDINSVLVTFS